MTVLLDENDCIKIADFGMAKVVRRNVIQFALPDTRELCFPATFVPPRSSSAGAPDG